MLPGKTIIYSLHPSIDNDWNRVATELSLPYLYNNGNFYLQIWNSLLSRICNLDYLYLEVRLRSQQVLQRRAGCRMHCTGTDGGPPPAPRHSARRGARGPSSWASCAKCTCILILRPSSSSWLLPRYSSFSRARGTFSVDLKVGWTLSLILNIALACPNVLKSKTQLATVLTLKTVKSLTLVLT